MTPPAWEGLGKACLVSSERTEAWLTMTVFIDRPGSVDHLRPVRTRLSLLDAQRLWCELEREIERRRRGSSSEVNQ